MIMVTNEDFLINTAFSLFVLLHMEVQHMMAMLDTLHDDKSA